MTEQHTCKALAIHCIDFRIQRFLNKYLDDRFPGGYDRVAAAGGAKYLAEGGQNGDFELEECGVSYKLHHPTALVLIQHEDCGAYGGSKKFVDLEAEKAFQKQEMEKAAAVLREKFPQCAVEGYFVELSGNLTSVV
ncbi:MAG TPA: carbonic anhydrase [Candidatus Paceibacterota bacterium]